MSTGVKMDEMLPATVVERDAVAKLLGLNNWRCGVHRFRSAPEIWADCLWWVDVQPSFDEPWIIAGTTTHEFSDTPRAAPCYERKAVLIHQQVSHVVQCREAAIEDAINAVPLVALSSRLSMDGIGYSVYTQAVVARSQFYFSNPDIKEWVALESALIDLGDEIAGESGSKELAELMVAWCKYTGGQRSKRTKWTT